jgi:hypothetical protein
VSQPKCSQAKNIPFRKIKTKEKTIAVKPFHSRRSQPIQQQLAEDYNKGNRKTKTRFALALSEEKNLSERN